MYVGSYTVKMTKVKFALQVKEGNYAFLWDNTVTSYMASVDCDFTEIGPAFDTKGLQNVDFLYTHKSTVNIIILIHMYLQSMSLEPGNVHHL